MASKIVNYPTMGRITVKIDDVDLQNRIVHATDSKNAKLAISFNFQETVFTIPKPGDFWLISRDQYQWYFEARLEKVDSDPILITDMKVGDTRLRAVGDLQIETTGSYLNTHAFGVTIWEKWAVAFNPVTASLNTILYAAPSPDIGAVEYTGTGGLSANTKTLSHVPLDIGSIQLFNNGSLVDPSTITQDTVNRKILRFSPALSLGVAIVYYQYTPTIGAT